MPHPNLDRRARAFAEFRRMLGWIAVAGAALTVASLCYLAVFVPLRLHMVIATIAGVFFSVLLGCGLFAAAFFSDKSGHDAAVARRVLSADDAPTDDPRG